MGRYVARYKHITRGVRLISAASVVVLMITLAIISGCGESQFAPSTSPVRNGSGNAGGPDVAAPEPAPGPLGPIASPDLGDRQKLLDRQLSLLRAGHLAYRPPSPMKVGSSRRIVARVSGPSSSPDFELGLPGSGPIRTRDVKVGSDLVADLSGDKQDFQISRVGDDDGKRTLATGTFAEWQWDVLALRSGKKTLSLVLYVLLQDENRPLDVKTFDETIDVEVDPMYTATQWIKAYGPYTGLTVPVIVGFLWRVIHRRKNATTPAGISKDGS